MKSDYLNKLTTAAVPKACKPVTAANEGFFDESLKVILIQFN